MRVFSGKNKGLLKNGHFKMSKIENLNVDGRKCLNLLEEIYIIKELKELLDRDHSIYTSLGRMALIKG